MSTTYFSFLYEVLSAFGTNVANLFTKGKFDLNGDFENYHQIFLAYSGVSASADGSSTF